MQDENSSQMNSSSTTSFTKPDTNPTAQFLDMDEQDFNLNKEECFTIRYNEACTHVAGGFSTGKLGIFDVSLPPETLALQKKTRISEYPLTCLRWKPHNRTTLLVVDAEGFINQVHTPTGKVLQTIEEKGNPLMCCDYSTDGELFATGGNDKVVRLYDDLTKTLISTLVSTKVKVPQHSNRIFSVKFSKENQNLLLSGGWDNSILLYDIRAREVQNYLYGPHICGDGMDIKGDLLLTVSWTKQEQIQIFDLRMLSKKGVFNMTLDGSKNLQLENISYLYSCRFNPVNETFCVTGSNKNYLRIYNYQNLDKSIIPGERIKSIFDMNKLTLPCYCCDYDNTGKKLAYGCTLGKVDFQNLY